MKILKRLLLGFLSLIIVLIIMLFWKSVLSKSQKSQIASALMQKDYNPYLGTPGFAMSDSGVKIWYEDIGDPSDPAVLLIMGHSFTALSWPNYFVQPLVDEGYRVIRYDNRGLGLSTRMIKWTKSEAYSTRDMANDGIAILDHLNIDAAHIVGVSMGGMIAQDVAMDHPSRVRTLTLAMTTGELFGKGLSRPSAYFITNVLRIMAQNKGQLNAETAPRINVAFANILSRKKLTAEVEELAKITKFEYSDRGGWNFACAPQHTEAMKKRGGRWDQLQDIKQPCLIVHGTIDPIFGTDHAEKLHKYIPGSELVLLNDLGHFLPHDRCTELIQPLTRHMQKSQDQ